MARVSIEDCLQYIENRFALVAVASHRTRQLMEGKTPLVKTKNKEAVTALREIAEGLVVSVLPEGEKPRHAPLRLSLHWLQLQPLPLILLEFCLQLPDLCSYKQGLAETAEK